MASPALTLTADGYQVLNPGCTFKCYASISPLKLVWSGAQALEMCKGGLACTGIQTAQSHCWAKSWGPRPGAGLPGSSPPGPGCECSTKLHLLPIPKKENLLGQA